MTGDSYRLESAPTLTDYETLADVDFELAETDIDADAVDQVLERLYDGDGS